MGGGGGGARSPKRDSHANVGSSFESESRATADSSRQIPRELWEEIDAEELPALQAIIRFMYSEVDQFTLTTPSMHLDRCQCIQNALESAVDVCILTENRSHLCLSIHPGA